MNQAKGRLPWCNGCKKQISRNDIRVRHCWINEGKKERYPTRHQYHARTECLLEMSSDHLGEFLEDRRITMKAVVKVKKEIENLVKEKKE
jgi:hypothetical protein